MDIVYLLVPLSAFLVLAIVLVLWWAVYNDQFEDLEAHGGSILDDDKSAGVPMLLDEDQHAVRPKPRH